jgi:hypothetical protein
LEALSAAKPDGAMAATISKAMESFIGPLGIEMETA